MSLKERILEDIKSAMKAGDAVRLGTLRMSVSSIKNREIELRNGDKPLEDGEVLKVLEKEVKKRNEAAILYEQGGRADLSSKEKQEASIISHYLPPQASEGEIEEVIRKIKSRGANDFASIMKEVMKELRGKADGRRVGEIIKKTLE